MARTQARTQGSTVIGVFQDRAQAERAVQELHRAGFTEQQIGIAARHDEVPKGARTTGTKDTKGEEGAGTGLLAGAGIGGVLGAAAVGLIPGIGPIIAAGALAGILGGAAAGAATGGLVGWLAGMGVPEEEARHYEREFKAGRTLVTVHADGRYDEAVSILRRFGGSTGLREAAGAEGDEHLELREEELRARTQPVETGEVVVGKDVVTERGQLQVPRTREEVEVEYHPVEGRRPARGDITDDQEIRVPVREEQVRTEKDTVVTGEVDVRKRTVEEPEQVTETVRREVPRVEHEGDVEVRSTEERHL